MELFDTTMVGLERAMSGSQLRQQVLANNLANANTPGFKRSDVDFHAALAQAFAGRPHRGASSPTPTSRVQTDSAATMRGRRQQRRRRHRDGRPRENSLDYQALTSVADARASQILETAIGQVQLMGMFDALRHLRLRHDRRAPAHGRDRREPRQRRHDARPQRQAVPAPGGRRSRRRRRASARCWRGVQVGRHRQDPSPLGASTTRATRTPTSRATSRCRTSNPVTEMVDLITASRGYEANVPAMNAGQADVHPDPRHPPLMPIPSSSHPAIGPLGDRIGLQRRRHRRPRRARRVGGGGALRRACSTQRDRQPERPADIRRPGQSQALATGKATDVSAVVMQVEQPRSRCSSPSQVRNKAVDAYQELMRMQI